MNTGLDTKDSQEDGFKGSGQMFKSGDPVAWFFNCKKKTEPGKTFKYCNCTSHMVACVLN